jgi:HK97 gp10 family phage protein
MSGKTLEIQGLEELEKGLSKLEAYVYKDVIKKALTAAAELIAEGARRLVPVKTGALRNAIRVRAGRSSNGSFSVLAAVGKRWFVGDQFYGAFQEFGWKSGSRQSDQAAVSKRIARQLQRESRAARDGKGSGLAPKGSAFRARQEAYFQREGQRRAAKSVRRQIPGEHFMEYAFNERKSQAMNLILNGIKEGLDRELKN